MSEWLEQLPEGLRDAPFIGKAESMEDAIGKLAHAAKLVGTSVRIPGEDASDDDREAFYAKLSEVPGVARLPGDDDPEGLAAILGKLGAPAEHTEYKLPEIEDFSWDEGVAEDLRKYAQQAGLTKAQFKQFASKLAEQERTAEGEASTALENIRKELRMDWGETLEDREAMIRGWLDASDAPASMKGLFEERQLPLDTMNWLMSVAKQFKGDVSPMSKDGDGGKDQMDPSDAREAIQDLLNNPAYFDNADPRHKDLVKKMVHLQKLANASQAG